MNLRQIVEFLGRVSALSPNLIEAAGPLSHEAVRKYGDCSQTRTRNWQASLDSLPHRLAAAPVELRPIIWQQAEATLVDVLAGGMIARVWGTVLSACDRSRRTVVNENVARTILAGQLEVEKRVLRLMIDGPFLTLERVSSLDKLRRRIERWTDVFVGHVVKRYALSDFAFDLDRALEFGDEQLRESWGPRGQLVWDLYFVCIPAAFREFRLPGGIEAERRVAVVQSIMGCIPRDLYLDDGVLKSVRLHRLLRPGRHREGPPQPGRFASGRLAARPGDSLNADRKRLNGRE